MPLDQPASRMARNLLDHHVPMSEALVQRHERRHVVFMMNATHQAWPAAFMGRRGHRIRSQKWCAGELLNPDYEPGPAPPLPTASVGYLILGVLPQQLQWQKRCKMAFGSVRLANGSLWAAVNTDQGRLSSEHLKTDRTSPLFRRYRRATRRQACAHR